MQVCRGDLLAADALPTLLYLTQHALAELLSQQPAGNNAGAQMPVIGEEDLQLLLGVLELLAADVSDVSSTRAWQVGSLATLRASVNDGT